MKKHMFFIGTLTNGGAERVVSTLASQMATQGIAVEIITYYKAPISYAIHPAVKIVVVEEETGTKNNVTNLLWVRKYFKNNAKIIISFLAPFNILALTANLFSGIPIIVADRNDPAKVPSNKAIRYIRDFLYRFADGIVVQTKKNQEYFSKQVQRKSIVIYNPVNLDEYAKSAIKIEKEKKFVTAGRLTPQKNHKMLIQAFANIIKQFPEYQLIIYGEGPIRVELENKVKELGLEHNIHLPGNTSVLYEKIKTAMGFVMSSDYEGMPNALIEAMCLGLPCISTKVSGATDLINNYENGILIEVNNQEELETAIQELIENPSLADRLADNAIALNQLLEPTKIMKEWTRFVEKIIMEK